MPRALRVGLSLVAAAALAGLLAWLVARSLAGSAVEPAGPRLLGAPGALAGGTICVPLEEAPDSGIVGCSHADEVPPNAPAGERRLDQLVAEAGGPGVLEAFGDRPARAPGPGAGPQPVTIIDGPGVNTGIRRPAGTSSTATAASSDVASTGAMTVYATVPTGGTPGIPCIGDGISGNRVQALYVYPSNRPNRAATIVPLIRRWAADVDRVLRLSADQKLARRHFRWVHSASCVLSVRTVKVSRYATSSFSRTISELAAKGFKRSDRRYLIWFDANSYCGIGRMISDDRAGRTNRNNGKPYGPAGYARTDAQCWGLLPYGHSVEAHELMHTIGAVQRSAPRSTWRGHCFDEYDTMCYPDGGRGPMRYPCAKSHEAYLDCGKNDYFNPRPASGSYLARKWNTARSSFMSSTAIGDPLIKTATQTAPAGSITAPTASITVSWTAVLDAPQARTELALSTDGAAPVALPAVAGTGKTATITLARGKHQQVWLRAVDTAGRWSAWWVLPAQWVEPQNLPPVVTAPVAELGWRSGGQQEVSVTWTTSDEGWSVTSQLEEQVNGGAWTLVATTTDEWFQAMRPLDATYRYRVRARDELGLWSGYATGSAITLPPDGAPTASIVSAIAWDDGLGTLSIQVEWTTSDDDAVVASEVQEENGETRAYDGWSNWDSFDGRAPGTYRYRARAQDSAGQWSAWSAWVTAVPSG